MAVDSTTLGIIGGIVGGFHILAQVILKLLDAFMEGRKPPKESAHDSMFGQDERDKLIAMDSAIKRIEERLK